MIADPDPSVSSPVEDDREDHDGKPRGEDVRLTDDYFIEAMKDNPYPQALLFGATRRR